jgi:hypothetical protein
LTSIDFTVTYNETWNGNEKYIKKIIFFSILVPELSTEPGEGLDYVCGYAAIPVTGWHKQSSGPDWSPDELISDTGAN